MTRNEHSIEEVTKIARDSPCKENNIQDGSDSGVEMGTRRYNTFEGDPETDSISSCAHSCPETRLTPGDGESNGESSLISYDGASENGSESSSLDDTKKCRPNCINLQVYCTKTNGCRPTPASRSKLTSFNDSIRGSRQSTSAKCAPSCDTSKNSTTERNRLRSCSGSRQRSTMSPDDTKWLDKSKIKALPYSLSDAKVTNTFETYATLPRRKQKESDTRSPREPSLNRAASLRKKFLENSLMTTSLNSSISPSSTVKTMPPYVKLRTKTKIYHEIATQTALTNGDVDRALADSPFKIYNERVPIQVDPDKLEKRAEEELKKLKKENSKQRTVIEWLEGELSAAKEEKLRIQNRFATVEQRIFNLLIHKGAKEDVLSQLEREVTNSNRVLSRQLKEINELQQLCCIMQKDLDSVHSAQKANEVESLELQEFLQAEKLTLTDSLKDLETELEVFKKRIQQQEEELSNKKNECNGLTTINDQLKLENQAMKVRLAMLERRCKELLVHQGAVTSSATVALSGLGSRFEQLLEQLSNTYNISDTDLQDDIYQNEILANGCKEMSNSIEKRSSVTPSWLKVISSIMSKTSAGKEDCNGTEGKKLVECSGCKNPEEKKTPANLTTSDDSLYLTKFDDDDSRRNSILSDVYTADDNLTLDFGITESLTDISESVLMRKNLERFNAESFNHDVSLVEQVLEIDNLVSKVFKAILFIELDNKSTIDE